MQELILGNVAVVAANKKYTDKEKDTIEALTKSGAVIEVVIPDTIESSDFETALSAVCKVYVKAEMQKETMFPVLGRLVSIASKNPELRKKFDTFDAFLDSIESRFGVGRSTCYEAKNFVERWIAVLPPEEYKAVGRVKLKLISQAISKGAEDQKSAKEAITFAKENTAEALEDYLDKKHHTGKGSTTGAVMKIASNKKQNKIFVKWFDDPRVAAYCGSDDMADILEHMIEECKGEWEIAGQEKIDKLAASAEVLNEGEPAQAEA